MSFVKTTAIALVVLATAIPAAAQTTVFINEIHYDNASTDVGEAIEIAGPAGTDLSGWSIVLYNGNGGASYNTTSLTGTIPDVCGGFGVIDVTYPTNGIQNGSPDGIALVDSTSTVVQFLSYEGSFIAADGPATGLGSTDIGVSESSSTPVGDSLQLTGTGTAYEHFTWATPAPNTFGACNTGQTFSAPSVNLLINETDADTPGTDILEFVELYDGGIGSSPLDGWVVVFYNGNGDISYNAFDLDGFTSDASGYFVLGNVGVSPTPNIIFPSNGLQNGADAVAIYQGDAADFPNGTPVTTAGLIDAIVYDTNDGDDAGLLVLLNPGQPQVNEGGAGDKDNHSNQRCPNGEGGARNTAGYLQNPPTPAADNQCGGPPVADLFINETDADTPGTDTLEFVELYDGGIGSSSLDGFVVVFYNGNGDVSYNAFDLDGFSSDASGYFVLGNVGVSPTPEIVFGSNGLQNGADAVAIYQGDAADFPNGTPVTTTGLIDAIVYDTNDGDDAGLLVLLNPGQPQVNEGGAGDKDNHSNQRCPNGEGGARNTAGYDQDTPTPAADNQCPAPPPPAVEVEIFEIQGSGAFSPFVGLPVITDDNTVTAVRANGFFIQTPEARSDDDPQTSDGIFVFTSSTPTVAVGDQVDVTGTVEEFFDFTEIGGSPLVTVDSSGNALPIPETLDETLPSGFPADPPELESLEGMLVTASGIATGPSDRFGDIAVVARTVRSFREPGIEFPGLPGLPLWDGNPEIFEIDPDALGLPDVQMFTNQTFDATGALGFSFGDYQLLPTTLTIGPPPALPIPVRGPLPDEFTVASQNMLRLMSGDIATRAAKLSLHIRTVLEAPDILAVQEVDTLATLQALADQITADDPAILYTPFLIEGNDVSGIDVGFLIRDTITVFSVTQFGEDLEFFFNDRWWTTYDRPPLVLDAEYIGAGEPFPIFVIANHLRSLSGVDTGNEFARQKRFEQALQLSLFIQNFQITNPDTPLVVTGDFNAFQFTDGYVDVMGQITGDLDPAGALLPGTDEVDPNLFNEIFALPQADRYSFIFSGNAQGFDYMLTSASLAPVVAGVEYSRGNADAPAGLFLADGTPLRASDHDGVVLYILADSDFDGVPNSEDMCPGTTIPEGVPTQRLGTNRWALVDEDGIFDTKPPNGKGNGLDRSFTIEDTAGCSCEQIIDELHLGSGHTKFGCSIGAMETWIDQVQE